MLFMALEFNLRFMGFAFVTLGCRSCMGQIPQQTTVPSPENNRAGRGIALAGESRPAQPLSGSVSGTVADQSGAVVAGAHVRLTGEDQSPSQEVLAGEMGNSPSPTSLLDPFSSQLPRLDSQPKHPPASCIQARTTLS